MYERVQEPVNLGLGDKLFQGDGFRPGDLVWVLVADSGTMPAQQPLSSQEQWDCAMDMDMKDANTPKTDAQCQEQASEEYLPTMDAGPAFTAACDAIRGKGAAASATAICRCIVQSCFLDSGCTAHSKASSEEQADQALNSPSGAIQATIWYTTWIVRDSN